MVMSAPEIRLDLATIETIHNG